MRADRLTTRCVDSGLPGMERQSTAVETCRPEILPFLYTGITKRPEGTNRVIRPSSAAPAASVAPQPTTTHSPRTTDAHADTSALRNFEKL